MIATELQAKHHAKEHHDKAKTLVVSEHGDIYIDCNVDDTCDELESDSKQYFILKGFKTEKKKKDEPKVK